MYEENTHQALIDHINEELEELSKCKTEEEKQKVIQNLSELYRLKIEEDDKHVTHESETEEKSKDRFVQILGVAVPATATFVMFLLGLNFEKSNTICSTFVKSLVTKMTPRK